MKVQLNIIHWTSILTVKYFCFGQTSLRGNVDWLGFCCSNLLLKSGPIILASFLTGDPSLLKHLFNCRCPPLPFLGKEILVLLLSVFPWNNAAFDF